MATRTMSHRILLSVLAAIWLGMACPLQAKAPATEPTAPFSTVSPDPSGLFRNEKPPFTLQVPAGFESLRFDGGSDKLAVFRKGSPGETGIWIVLIRLPLEETPADLEKKKLKGVDLVYREQWKGQEISVARITSPGPRPDEIVVTRNAIVPLAGNAVMLQLAGPQARDAELGALLKTLLASLDGPSHKRPAKDTARSKTSLALLLAAVVIMIMVFRRHQAIQRRKEENERVIRMPADDPLPGEELPPPADWRQDKQ